MMKDSGKRVARDASTEEAGGKTAASNGSAFCESVFALFAGTNGRERNQTAVGEFAKKISSGEILQLSGRSQPVPMLTELLCQTKTAPV